MKAVMIVEDRDLAYLILDTTSPPDGARIVDVQLQPPVRFDEVSDEDGTQWTEHDGGSRLVVVPRAAFDYNGNFDEIGFPIPTPVVLLDTAEYERLHNSAV